mmetsp:Transcript_7689/g.34826  ORF Transcript_7689/g.34826 Transcript_7689/m.34826 type:complete len:257 (+) Transcript_7689:2222-2992(+)
MGCVAPRSSDAAMASAAGDSSAMVVRVVDIAPPFFEEADPRSATATDFDPSVEGSASTSSSALNAPTYAGIRPPAPPPLPVSIEPLPPETRSMDTHVIRPLVMVPVLSSATVSTWAEASRTSPPRSSSPSLAPAEVATRTAVGVARPRAHGHATTRTSVASFKAPNVAPAPPEASKSAPGKKASPAKFQNAKVVAEAAMTPYTKGPATASASRCTGAARACASATVRAIPAATLPSPAVVALMVSGPSNTAVPAET